MFRKENSSNFAKERLKLMMESDTFEHSNNEITRLKKEIATLVSRYFDVSADMFEIKITLKQDKKRV